MRRRAAPLTQFGRMCAQLGIQIIPASSPQAKGRIERQHGTQQDRLVKKLRRAGIADVRGGQRVCGEPAIWSITMRASRSRRPPRKTSIAGRHRARSARSDLPARGDAHVVE